MGDNVYDLVDENVLVISNHQSTGDVPVMMHLLQNKSKVINNMLWIMDHLFRHTQFGWVSRYRGDYFIHQVFYFQALIYPLRMDIYVVTISLLSYVDNELTTHT